MPYPSSYGMRLQTLSIVFTHLLREKNQIASSCPIHITGSSFAFVHPNAHPTSILSFVSMWYYIILTNDVRIAVGVRTHVTVSISRRKLNPFHELHIFLFFGGSCFGSNGASDALALNTDL